jgi:cyclic pyranopterin phosphate synthase
MPENGVELVPRNDILTFEEIARVVRVGATLGLTKIRLTGGEPTVRKELPELVQMLSAIPGIREIAMTTNAARMAQLAGPLKAAGLHRVNISLDTLRRDRTLEIARRDCFDDVQRGIGACVQAGLTPLKFNTVVMRGTNDDELADLARFAHGYDAQIRFIEYMPMGSARFDEHNKLMTAEEMRSALADDFDLVQEQTAPASELSSASGATDPARGWVCRRTGARIAFITSMSEHFCATCNRMRLTAGGALMPCLHQNAEVDARQILRSGKIGGQLDGEIAGAFRAAAGLKWEGHHMTNVIPLYSAREMVSIGG